MIIQESFAALLSSLPPSHPAHRSLLPKMRFAVASAPLDPGPVPDMLALQPLGQPVLDGEIARPLC